MEYSAHTKADLIKLKSHIRGWAEEFGFSDFGVTDTDISVAEQYLFSWLNKKQHGEMTYMEKHGTRRTKPDSLIPDTIRILSFKMNYWKEHKESPEEILNNLKFLKGESKHTRSEAVDNRIVGIGSQILRDLGVKKMKLLGSEVKYPLAGFDLEITEFIN